MFRDVGILIAAQGRLLRRRTAAVRRPRWAAPGAVRVALFSDVPAATRSRRSWPPRSSRRCTSCGVWRHSSALHPTRRARRAWSAPTARSRWPETTDYAATGSVDRAAFGPLRPPCRRSLQLAASALATSGDLQWLRSRTPAARRGPVLARPARATRWCEYVTSANAEACLPRQREVREQAARRAQQFPDAAAIEQRWALVEQQTRVTAPADVNTASAPRAAPAQAFLLGYEPLRRTNPPRA